MVKAITIKTKTMRRLQQNKAEKSYSEFLDDLMDKQQIPLSISEDKYEH